jgi:hypothetical protein
MKPKLILCLALVLSGIFANAADTNALRVVVIPSKAEVRVKEKFKVALRVENTTTTNQTVRVWSCSWDEEWQTSNANISWLGWACTKNGVKNVEILPGGAYTNELEMLIPEPISKKTISFRMGFTPIDSEKTFWSDAVIIGVAPQAATVAKVKLKFVKVDSEETNGQDGYGKNAMDGNPNTYWHTQWQSNTPPLPHEIIIELIPPSIIKGFTYLPRQDESDHGTIKDYEYYVSKDGKDFGSPVKKGTFEPGKAEKIETFSPMKCRFIKLKAISEINGLPWTSAAEIRIIRSGEDASVMTYQIKQATNLAGSAAQTQFEYETADGKVTITAYIGDGGAVSIPETINGLPVASIGWLSFGYCHKVTHVTIPNSVTSIGVGAFDGCSGLTNIAIPRTVTSIGFNSMDNYTNESFGSCINLKAITVDADNPAYSSLDGVLFNKDRTTLIQFPAGRTGSYTILHGVTRIETKAFIGCGGLTAVKIPNTVTSIGDYVFYECRQLGDIKIPSSVTTIGTGIFLEDEKLDHFVFPKNIINLGSQKPIPLD